MQEITVFALLLFVALYAFSVYIEWLRLQHKIKQDWFRFQHEKSLDANGKVGRDKNGRFTKIK